MASNVVSVVASKNVHKRHWLSDEPKLHRVVLYHMNCNYDQLSDTLNNDGSGSSTALRFKSIP